MADLSAETTLDYWKTHDDPSLFRVITFIESVEDWTLDGDEDIEAAITKLGDTLDHLSTIDIGELDSDDDIIKLISSIKLGRSLKILQILDDHNPGTASRLLMHSEEMASEKNDSYNVFLKRNIMFERLRLASRIFSPERFQMVVGAIEDEA